MTPHINAKQGEIAKTVIMPGDPRRAKYIAEKYLENPKLVNEVRNILAYTGTYKGKEVTIMASGMGMPSMAIYSHELFTSYEVENIIRLGSCKSLTKEIELCDIILATSAYTTSNFAFSYTGENRHVISSSEELNNKVRKAAENDNIKIFEGQVNTSDVFYCEFEEENEETKKCIGVEMETFGLLYVANHLNKKATSVITVSDNVDRSKILTPEEREKSFDKTIELVLNSIIL